MIIVDICLSDIPKDRIKKSEKNGKSYASFVIDERKEKDQYNNTHSVAMSQSKEERDAKEKKLYVGNGKEYSFGSSKPEKKADYEQLADDLPF